VKIINIPKKIWLFYYEGFKSMKLGKTLWVIILIKLFVMFVILKWMFFPNVLKENFENDIQRGNFVMDSLTKKDKY